MNRIALLTVTGMLCLLPQLASAQREASFVQPSASAGGRKEGDELIAPSPKALDVGETSIGVTKRVTMFFTNFSGRDAAISNLSINADSNVRTEAVQNDCAALQVLKANDKCTVIIEITPNSPGKWTAEVVAVHDGPGRVSRATLNGATSGSTDNNGQLPGLSLVGAAKDQQIDFGDVAGGNHAVRTVLLANDSPNPLRIERIMLMAADKGLTLLDKDGCTEGLEVPAGSSCPVTVMWAPERGNGGEVSTDLIIRHTGPIGFAVIPVRGKSGAGSSGETAGKPTQTVSGMPTMAIPPLSPDELFLRAAGEAPVASGKKSGARKAEADGATLLTLRGTTGDQALIGTAEGTVALVGAGQNFKSGGDSYRILFVDPTSVTLESAGRQIVLALQKPAMIVTGTTAGGKNKTAGQPSSQTTGQGTTK